jgi:hypothetical protein
VALVLVYGVFAAADAAFSRDARRLVKWTAVVAAITLVLVAIGMWAC